LQHFAEPDGAETTMGEPVQVTGLEEPLALLATS
jgi:hypothetical protein